jgi:hypothetical protein
VKIHAPDRFIQLAIKALDHDYEYTRAVQSQDTECREVAEYFREIERMGRVVKRAHPRPRRNGPGVGLGL